MADYISLAKCFPQKETAQNRHHQLIWEIEIGMQRLSSIQYNIFSRMYFHILEYWGSRRVCQSMSCCWIGQRVGGRRNEKEWNCEIRWIHYISSKLELISVFTLKKWNYCRLACYWKLLLLFCQEQGKVNVNKQLQPINGKSRFRRFRSCKERLNATRKFAVFLHTRLEMFWCQPPNFASPSV